MGRRGQRWGLLLAVLWAALGAAGCSWTVEPRVAAALGAPIVIGPGWTALWPEAGLRLEFEDVVSDDRCPRQVLCEWAGEARLQVAVELDGYPVRHFQMSTYPYFGEDLLLYAGYAIRLIEVAPYPELPNEELPKSDYRITLVATAAPEDLVHVSVGTPFTLQIGQAATLAEDELLLTWQSLLGDSRCPTRVSCVWAGEATLAVTWEYQGTAGRADLTSNADVGATEAIIGPYRLRLLGVTPIPELPDAPIRPEEYASRWRIETP